MLSPAKSLSSDPNNLHIGTLNLSPLWLLASLHTQVLGSFPLHNMDAHNQAPQIVHQAPVTILLPCLWGWPLALLLATPALIAYLLATLSPLGSLSDFSTNPDIH